MRIEIAPDVPRGTPVRVGDAYPVRGGRHRDCLWVVVSIYERSAINGDGAVALMVDPNGQIVGSATYGLHYFEDLSPVGRVDGLEDVNLVLRSRP